MKKKLPLSPQEARTAAKVLVESGYSSRQIEKWLGISDTTVLVAAKAETPDEYKQFEAEFKESISQSKQKGLSLVMGRMLNLIPKYQRLDHLVKAAEYFEGIRGGNNINIQGEKVLVIPNELAGKYGISPDTGGSS